MPRLHMLLDSSEFLCKGMCYRPVACNQKAEVTEMTTSSNQRMTGLLRIAVVGLALATAYIHATLGGVLFTLNAIGYTVLAVAVVLPGPLARYRWLVRLGLIGFTVATIGGWIAFGARFPLAYLDKGIEAGLVLVLVIDLWRSDGSPVVIARRIGRLPATVVRAVSARA